MSCSPDKVKDDCNALFCFQLYTAKLYKGRHEFLQLVPKRGKKKEPLKTFPLKGVNIKVTERKHWFSSAGFLLGSLISHVVW